MHNQFIVRDSDADCSSETHGALVSVGEQKLCKARACTKRLDETKWSETRDETPRRFEQRLRQDPRCTASRQR